MERYVFTFSSSLERIRNCVPITKLQLKKVLLVCVIGVGGGAKSSRMSFFRGVKVRVDEKWTWGEGGSKKAENGWTSFVQAPFARLHTFCTVNYPQRLLRRFTKNGSGL